MQQQPVTDVELVDALARWRRGLPPPPSQPFTVHNVFIFDHDPSYLYCDTVRPKSNNLPLN